MSTMKVEMTGMQKMASKMWAPWIAMGLMIVAIAFILSLVVQNREAFWWTFSKADREAAAAGTAIVEAKGFVEATKSWLPGFKFLGLGMMLGGITFLLATILGNLRVAGGMVQQAAGVEVKLPKPPVTATLFPMLMMMGVMVLIASFVIGIYLGVQSASYWNHSIEGQIDAAQAGSALLAQGGRIAAIKTWVEPFKFVGMALLFSGIALALVTIVYALRAQSQRLMEITDRK